VANIAARAVFLPVESNLPSAGRWVTLGPGKRSGESDFDSGEPLMRIGGCVALYRPATVIPGIGRSVCIGSGTGR
jgi:hypothetical protein